jgi:hypothetical protein
MLGRLLFRSARNMIKATLDTNCLINFLDRLSKSATSVEDITELFNLGLTHKVDLAVTTRVRADIDNDKDSERGGEILRRCAMLPVVGSVARFGVTRFDGGDVWAGGNHLNLEESIKNILFPSLRKTDRRYSNKINDIDHLVGHKINGRDVFITGDVNIIKKGDALCEQCGILVMNPKDAVAHINTINAGDFFGSLIRGLESQIYWVSRIDGGRHVFPNKDILRSWYPSVSDVSITYVPSETLVSLPLRGNVTYRPGSRLLKTKYDTKIYAVSKGSVLRWVSNPAILPLIYGKNWQNNIDILPDYLACNYVIGSDIVMASDYNPSDELDSVNCPDDNNR